MSPADIMETLLLGNPIILVIMAMVINLNADKSTPASIESLRDVFAYKLETHSNLRKRDISNEKRLSDGEFHKLIEKKLTQHTLALEHLVQMMQTNEDLIKKLIENFGSRIPEPKMPEKVEMTFRRSQNGNEVATSPQTKTPWCTVASVCRPTHSHVCGYDDNFGYGRFDDVCHMLQVNCYWKYNFGLVAHCKPILN